VPRFAALKPFEPAGGTASCFAPCVEDGISTVPGNLSRIDFTGAALAQQRGDLIREVRSLMARWEADVGAEATERHLPTRSCRALTGSR
jgi:hypothetical protein